MFIDRVIEHIRLNNPDEWESGKAEVLLEAVCFNINNVVDYLEPLKTRDIDADIPNAAPPFENMWFEHKPLMRCHGIDQLKYVGIQIVASDPMEALRVLHCEDKYKAGLLRGDIKWALVATVFLEALDGNIQHIEAYSVLLVTDTGQVVVDDNDKILGITTRKPGTFDYLISLCFSSFWFAPLMSIAFMHCKNTTLKTINHSDRLQRSRAKKGKQPLVSYKILDVKPIKRIMETEGRINEVGLKRALHICRGHFKNYSGKGLFGKFRGLYWWDSQVRGDVKAGIALKDYKISGGK